MNSFAFCGFNPSQERLGATEGSRSQEINRNLTWVGWDDQSPTEGEGLFPDHRDSKRTGVVAGASVREPKFNIQGH